MVQGSKEHTEMAWILLSKMRSGEANTVEMKARRMEMKESCML